MRRYSLIWITVIAILAALAVPAVSGLAAVTDYRDDAETSVTLSDIVLAAKCFTGQAALTQEQMEKLDLDGSGEITLTDIVTLAKRYVAQMNVPSPSPTADPLPTANPSGKVLVVYFSATGNTRRAAEYVAAASGADLVMALEPVRPYTSQDLNWRDPNSRVFQERDNPALRHITLIDDTVADWELYDTVFVGYPIWFGIPAWPVDGFVEANDFTGKTVIPFCTSSSSGIGDSAQQLAQEAGTGSWLSGRRFSSDVSQAEVASWIDTLDLGA